MNSPVKTPRPHSVRLRVSQDELEWLRAKSDQDDRTIANILRKALREMIERES